ncbi:MAG: family 78 glycoside hydrolase catalytic domain [Gammaproteobacteria bacterium]|nr:family 78 glycoside hydrolase catalytic domain [Gammaproteobacteria bacterium]
MKKYILPLLVFALVACTGSKNTPPIEITSTIENKPDQLLVEGNEAPLNVHNPNPRLSWHSNVVSQAHYQVHVSSDKSSLIDEKPSHWDSGKITSSKSINIEYGGKALKSNDSLYWRVRVWAAGEEKAGSWSDVHTWNMGLTNKSDWKAKWIQVTKPVAAPKDSALDQWIAYAADAQLLQDKVKPHVIDKLNSQPTASLFRRHFTVSKAVKKAKLHSTAAGYYEVYLNGHKVDDRLMDPGQTDYDKRILYNTDEVSPLITNGANTIAVHLGSGWYNEEIAFSKPDQNLSYGQPKFIAQLELYYADGTIELINTDSEWLSHPSPILKEGIFSGEFYDATQTVPGWNTNAGNANLSEWQQVEVLPEWPTLTLEPQLLPPIRAVRKLTPKHLYNPTEGVWVVDFGQNFTGIPTLELAKLNLHEGQAIYLRYAEWADREGNISGKSGGSAPLLKQVDAYVAANDDRSTWTPTFSWHGFRYMEITGLESAPDLDAISAHLIRSDVKRMGTFVSSDTLLNKVHDMALWTYESNLISVPMDCPIRERAGWTGDAHAALITGNYNFDMQNFWEKYLGDFKTSAFVAPAIVPGKRTHGGSFDWAVAEVLIAWEHYRHHGDKQLLQMQYESLVEYMQAAQSKLSDSLLRIGYGDWCDPVRKPGMDRVGGRCTPQHTSATVTSSALLAHGAHLMSKIASVLDKPIDSRQYSNLYDRISQQFHAEFYDPKTGHYGSQTADAMALRFGITPVELRQSVADALNNDVTENWGGHASVGALGQTYLYLALSDYGYANTAHNIFKAPGYPGYSFLADDLQATSLWERKGGFDPAADPTGKTAPGRSLSHPFHSGYDGWFYEGLGGIRPLENSVGYQEFVLKPNFVKGLEFVNVSYTTGYGEIKSHWRRNADLIEWQIQIPNNSSAWIELPDKPKELYKAGKYSFVIQNK